MDSKTLIETFTEFAQLKNIDRPTLIRMLEDVFRQSIRKIFGTDDNFDIIINVDKGDLEIWRTREIISDDSEDIWDADKISLTDARKIQPDFEIGEELADEIKLGEFGRRIVQNARQTLIQKVKDLEKENLYKRYKDRVGEMISGEIFSVSSREAIVGDAEGNELVLPRSEQISKDRFRKGESCKAVVERVEINNGSPRIVLSRISPAFLERLFENEVPEIEEGVIVIRKVVREPGERAKVAVESFDDRIDPVGACVGMKGSRINGIVRELRNENIDVINYTSNLDLLISRSLSPAKVQSLKVEEEEKRIIVYLKPDQVSLAIGKGGQNIKLAGKLVGYEIEIFREGEDASQYDVVLQEFDDEIEQWIIDEFRRIGLDSARNILRTPKEDLLRRTDLEEETIDEVFEILKQEFEPESE